MSAAYTASIRGLKASNKSFPKVSFMPVEKTPLRTVSLRSSPKITPVKTLKVKTEEFIQ